MRSKSTTVVLVDDHPMFRKGLRLLLEDESDFSVIGEAGDGEGAIELIKELAPDIAVLDISMPEMNGIDAAKNISTNYPGTKIVALSIHSEKRFVEDMLIAGAAGYILKQSAPEDLVRGIRTVINNESYLSPSITSVVLSQFRDGLRGGTEAESGSPNIIGTKLYSPELPSNFVDRPVLVELLEKGSKLPLTLITAPAGYGKSVLVKSWLQSCTLPHCWISLDETDNDLRHFLHYFVHAMKSLFPGGLAISESLTNARALPPMHDLATNLIHDIDSLGEDFVVVLDDIHLVSEKSVYDFLSELFRHPSRCLHFIIIGRRDPFLPIASLRGNRKLTELRLKNLQFSLEETKQYLGMVLNKPMEEDDIRALHQRLEGWIGGLRLAVLSTNQVEDVKESLKNPKADVQYVMEYLFNEILEKQSQAFRNYLFTTALLDRFSAPLCSYICKMKDQGSGNEDEGWKFISKLNKENMFVVKLDSKNIWFRFHHLFKHLLKKQLYRNFGPQEINNIHTRASAWFANNGFIGKAIEHGTLAGNLDGAVQLFAENRHHVLDGNNTSSTLEKWISMFPQEYILQQPTLLLAKAWLLHNRYRMREVEGVINHLESIVSDQHLQTDLLAELNFFRGAANYWNGAGQAAQVQLINAREQLTAGQGRIASEVDLYLALARQMDGQNMQAVEDLHKQLLITDGSDDNDMYRCRLTAALGFVHIISGDLYQTLDISRRLMFLSTKSSLYNIRMWGHYLQGVSHLHLFELQEALTHFSDIVDNRSTMHIRVVVDAYAGIALVHCFLNQPEKSLEVSEQLLEYSNQTYDVYDSSLVSIARSVQARVYLFQGNVNKAEKCMQLMSKEAAVSLLFTWIEIIEITKARLLIAIGSISSLREAALILSGFREQTEGKHDHCHTIEIMVLQALCLSKQGAREQAFAHLEEAVALSGSGGWIRPFIEAGPTLIYLLKEYQTRSKSSKQARALAAILEHCQKEQSNIKPQLNNGNLDQSSVLEEVLTNRELEVLELLQQRLRNKEIGDKLYISPETVKSHMKNIFSKLGAVDRRDAVVKAIDLKILSK